MKTITSELLNGGNKNEKEKKSRKEVGGVN